jgi:hypothetical protein
MLQLGVFIIEILSDVWLGEVSLRVDYEALIE